MSSATFTWGRNLEKLRHQIFKVLRSKSHLAKKEMCLSLKIEAFRSLGWFHSFAIECWYQGFKASVRPVYAKRHFIYGSGIWSCRRLWFYLQGFIDIHCKMYASIQWFIGHGERGETMRLSIFGSKDEKKSYCLIKKRCHITCEHLRSLSLQRGSTNANSVSCWKSPILNMKQQVSMCYRCFFCGRQFPIFRTLFNYILLHCTFIISCYIFKHSLSLSLCAYPSLTLGRCAFYP